MIYDVTHITTYGYAQPVAVARSIAHMSPRNTPNQEVISRELVVEPEPFAVEEREDYFGNIVNSFAVESPHRTLVVRSKCRVRVQPTIATGAGGAISPTGLFSPTWEEVHRQFHSPLTPEHAAENLEAARFMFDSPRVPTHGLLDFARLSFAPGIPLLEAVSGLSHRIHDDFTYDPAATDAGASVYDVLDKRRGVCQDFAHLAVGAVRAMGLSARYVSGYLETDAPEGGQRLVGADASHAWFSVFCPGIGWVDFDPTNALPLTERHITVGWGRDFSDVTPLRGVVLGGGSQWVNVSVTVSQADQA